ncbi:unnamed protein product (macronuclear) [Paramecium tetraurelia]|uniref:Pseudouridine synthase I TruA alpha/beta domain-containing protein n=1 Tax=Paramecium tetraurelia TaxID=5888 RepID=A0DJ25_PARTE|nr:uncharacterized protein GSPATT00017399001 [Paramecium tetraurelia]CAK83042.1 unnamed protein product [Paramecium tetraurelia]|eukprot:XP_001450439.1 hypothetical protein (macronuclear) [Paramecium tetraurelia strain d4-2]
MDYNINKCIPQWNPHSMMHLLKQNLVSELNADSIKKIGVSRGARTDRGVHALCNVVSLKLQIDQKYCSSMTNNKLVDKWNIDWDLLIQELNSQLPSDIKVNAIKHVTQSFNVKHQADQRMYNYISPSFSTVDYVQNICNQYLGTHNFHNYTSKKEYNDPSSKRFIQDFRVQNLNFHNENYLKFTILGNSFMYHQIRKIIGTIYQIVQEKKDLSFIQDTFSQQQHSLYIAPQQGLYLREIKFTGYNMKKDIPQKLETDFKQQKLIDAFEDQLIQYICEQYESYNIFEEWYKEIQKHKQ